MAARQRATAAELRTIVANRVFGGTPLLDWISSLKWALYPLLVRFFPKLAIWIHEPESSAAYWNAITPGAIVIDGGANRGGYSILASRKTGASGRVFAFEPEPENFRRLTERMRQYANVTPVMKAIADKSGEMSLHLDTFHAGHSLRHEVGDGRAISVATTSLDDFVREYGLPGIDVLKLDIEGAELDAVAGMRALLGGKRRPTIVCEVHAPNRPEDMIAALRPFGYDCRMLDAELTGAAHAAPTHLLATPA